MVNAGDVYAHTHSEVCAYGCRHTSHTLTHTHSCTNTHPEGGSLRKRGTDKVNNDYSIPICVLPRSRERSYLTERRTPHKIKGNLVKLLTAAKKKRQNI